MKLSKLWVKLQFQLFPYSVFFSFLLGIRNGKTNQSDGADAVIHFLQQLFGQGENVFHVLQLLLLGNASGDLLEIVELDFQCQGIPGEIVSFQSFH